MKKTIAMLCTALFAAVACADTWTDPETGITWTYTVNGGKASVGGGSGGDNCGVKVFRFWGLTLMQRI